MNYQLELEKKINTLCNHSKPNLLLHCCCAVCSTYVLKYLSQHFRLSLLFYNPNIFPKKEYEHRKAELIRLTTKEDFGIDKILDYDYSHNEFLVKIAGTEHQPEGGSRCALCYELRLEKTALLAKQNNIGIFCSTLTISPHKNATILNTIGEKLAQENKVEWLPNDFKKKNGFLQANQLSAKYNIYRQVYCGCEFAMPQ